MNDRTYEKLTDQTLDQLESEVKKENELLFYSYLTSRRPFSTFYGQYKDNSLQHAVGYLSGMPFHAFSFTFQGPLESAELGPLVEIVREKHGLSGSGTSMVQVHELPVVMNELTIVSPPRKQYLMKLASTERLVSKPTAQKLTQGHKFYIETFANELDMIAFSPERLHLSPIYGVFKGDALVAMGGFHVYDERLMEIGNIGTLSDFRGQGLARDLTSAIIYEAQKVTSDNYLYVFADNTDALNLYHSLGFEVIGERFFVEFSLDN
ncbi:GNAT family N-acetyltransferase [Alteribacter populi]|uniref:GNAT family N-acetyltransferase n=1 Tax=Alteribacter populi TaxID=2011011 RepID=UPI000BBB1D5F|nr:GNAT family N-acetyltransferase [Alteribacter populi]